MSEPKGTRVEELKKALKNRTTKSNNTVTRTPQTRRKGKQWLKFQLDKRRYIIGFPIGWGAFSVVYFAKAHNFLGAELQGIQTSSSSLFQLNEKNVGNKETERVKTLPQYVAVKVVKIQHESKKKIGEKEKDQKKQTMPEIRMLRTPQVDKQEMYEANLSRSSPDKAEKDKLVAGFGETTKEAVKRNTFFEPLAKGFSLEINSFHEKEPIAHFDPYIMEDTPKLKVQKPSPVKKLVSKRIRKKRITSLSTVKSEEEEEDMEEVQEIFQFEKTSNKKEASSWYAPFIPIFLKPFQKESGTTATTLTSGNTKVEKSQVESEEDSFVELSLVTEVDSNSDTSSSKDSATSFLISFNEKKRQVTSMWLEKQQEKPFDKLRNEKNNQLITNQLRKQVDSVVTRLGQKNASQMEHLSLLSDAVDNHVMSPEEKHDYLELKKKDVNPKLRKSRKRERKQDLAVEIRALRIMRGSKFAIYLFDVVQAPEEVWLVTEFAHIGCLYTFFEFAYPGGAPDHIVKWILAPIFIAVNYMHKRKMIHRDLKPSNIVLTQAGIPKLCDFGMVKEFTKEPVFKEAGFCGTEIYAPPEAFGKNQRYDTSFDSWSLALCMISLLHGCSNAWDFKHRVTEKDVKFRPNLKRALGNKKHKKHIQYLSTQLNVEVAFLALEDSTNKVKYSGLYKRLNLFEKQDLEDELLSQALLKIYYNEKISLLSLKKQAAKAKNRKAIDEDIRLVTEKLECFDKSFIDDNAIVTQLKNSLRKTLPNFNKSRRKTIRFIKRMLSLYGERPKVEFLLSNRYWGKLVTSWTRFDSRKESKLLDIAITGEASILESKGMAEEFFRCGKEVALKIHQHFISP